MNLKKTLKIALWIILLFVIVIGGFLAFMWQSEWRPDEVEIQSTGGLEAEPISRDTLKIVSWNIGYAGLGDDMDFFYDGGKSVQCSRERTQKNLQGIIELLKEHRDADFILLQEVDMHSKRSYYMNQYDSIRNALPEFMGWYGLNYVSPFVPIPVTDPIGEVRSGVVILSRYAPQEVIRLQYPGGFSFPVRMFNLKRCLLTASFKIEGLGNMLYINNTHNTAYDSGGMREQEFSFLRNYLTGKPYSVTAGDWNSNPPQYNASEAELTDPNFAPIRLKAEQFLAQWHFVADTTTYSCRYGYEPYDPKTTTRTIIDFALTSDKITPLTVRTLDLQFKNSDHNPVIFTIKLDK